MKHLFFCFVSLFPLFACTDVQSKGAEKAKEVRAEEILKTLNKGEAVMLVNAIVVGDLNFSEVKEVSISSPRQVVADVRRNVFFQNCVFLGEVSAHRKMNTEQKQAVATCRTRFAGDVCFHECDFRKGLDMNGAVVCGELNLSNSIFNGDVFLNQMQARGKSVAMTEIDVKGTFDFINTVVSGDLNLMDATFAKDVSFSGLNVCNMNLNNVQVGGRFFLSESMVNGIVMMNYAQCDGEAQFSFSRFADRVDICQTTFGALFSVEKSKFWGDVRMNGSSFASDIVTEKAVFWSAPEMRDIVKPQEQPVAVEVKTSATILLNH